jgi:hypothetical protein
MSQKETPMSNKQSWLVRREPCDQVVRYEVAGRACTYGQAYDAVFIETQCLKMEDPDLKKTIRQFTPEGIRRISILNARYRTIAKEFLNAHYLALFTKHNNIKADQIKIETP